VRGAGGAAADPQLAQANLARLRWPLDSPEVAEFVAGLDRINRLAERSPGFVWRFGEQSDHANLAEATGDPQLLINLSVWTGYEPLHAFVYRGAHGGFVRRRAVWFERIPTPATVLWWVPSGHRPDVPEALARIRHVRRYGPTPRAFTVRTRFTPDGRAEGRRPG
jgi:hypothetical protein